MDQAHTPFADLDRAPAPMLALIIASLEAMSRHPEIRRVRRVGHTALRPMPGQRLLDAGCGSGDVARDLAAAVGPAGEVIALDYSAHTIAAARRAHDGSPVRYRTGDVADLDLPADSVDGVWCERVLQHVREPDRVVAEFARVTRPGGRICLVDTDWESLAFDGPAPELAAAVAGHMRVQFTPGQRDMGRTLRRRMVRAGLSGIDAVPVTLCFTTPESAGVVLPMVNANVPPEARVLPGHLRDDWLAEVGRAGARGDFLAVLTIWVAAGTV